MQLALPVIQNGLWRHNQAVLLRTCPFIRQAQGGDGLQGLPESHVVGQHAVKPVGRQPIQPMDAAPLVGAQLDGDARQISFRGRRQREFIVVMEVHQLIKEAVVGLTDYSLPTCLLHEFLQGRKGVGGHTIPFGRWGCAHLLASCFYRLDGFAVDLQPGGRCRAEVLLIAGPEHLAVRHRDVAGPIVYLETKPSWLTLIKVENRLHSFTDNPHLQRQIGQDSFELGLIEHQVALKEFWDVVQWHLAPTLLQKRFLRWGQRPRQRHEAVTEARPKTICRYLQFLPWDELR